MLEMNFTEKERHAIDAAYAKMENDEDVTADEMRLIIRFEKWRTSNSEEALARYQIFESESKARIEEARKTHETARMALKEIAQRQKERYERTLKNV